MTLDIRDQKLLLSIYISKALFSLDMLLTVCTYFADCLWKIYIVPDILCFKYSHAKLCI